MADSNTTMERSKETSPSPSLERSDASIAEVEMEGLLEPQLEHDLPQRARRTLAWTLALPWCMNIFLAIVILFLIHSGRPASTREHPDDQGGKYSPLEDVGYIPVTFQQAFGHILSPYQGFPNDEKDQLWQDLYSKGVTLHVSEIEHGPLLNHTEHVPVPGYEKDYMVGLDVFHQLHCLNMIRMGFYPRRYNASMVRPDGTVDYGQWLHIDHCIESLRQSVLCHADTGVNTFSWLPRKKMAPELNSVHICRNFSQVREWAFDRFVNVSPSRMQRVENGVVVDYSTKVPDPEKGLEDFQPAGWNYTVDDL